MSKEQIIEKYRRNIVFIGVTVETEEETSVRLMGTGFVVDGQYVVTSSEVYRKAESMAHGRFFAGVLEKTEGGVDMYQTVSVSFADIDDARGVCVLAFKERRAIGFSLDDFEVEEDRLKAGVDALVFGFAQRFPAEPRLIACQTMVGAVEMSTMSIRYSSVDRLICDFRPWPESLGSPCVDLDTGRIIGVLTGTYQLWGKDTRAIPLGHGLVAGGFTAGGLAVAEPATKIYDTIDSISLVMPVNPRAYDDEEDASNDEIDEDELAETLAEEIYDPARF